MAATGTPTPNIGLRIPIGTDPASVDDINYNSNLLDTKLGAVRSDSVQDQIDTLNGKITNNVYSTRVSLDVNESFAPNYQKAYYIDISSYKAAYNTVVLLGDAGADGSTFSSFGLKYCYIDGNTACVSVINLSSNTVELKKVGASILCVNPK